jgi:ATP-binding cassette, subfamily G (WHITE), member 2, SNQ2
MWYLCSVEKAENIQHREIGVYFKDLLVTGLGASVSHQPTVGSLFSPQAQLEGIQEMRHPAVKTILEGFEGVVRPGEMLCMSLFLPETSYNSDTQSIVVLGSPGSGCTTLLKTLSNQTSGYHNISGDIHFSSLSPQDLAKHYRGDVQYCPEDDIHFATLTVAETLTFAAKTRTPRNRLNDQKRKEFEQTLVNMLLNVFGLEKVADTKVGDAYVRGISGGQKKRVSLAEVMATRCLLGAWDGATKGLEYVVSFKIIAQVLY